ncbi:hypothetical protein HHI36_010319, partial [Cryptolaemus montrouzieri]
EMRLKNRRGMNKELFLLIHDNIKSSSKPPPFLSSSLDLPEGFTANHVIGVVSSSTSAASISVTQQAFSQKALDKNFTAAPSLEQNAKFKAAKRKYCDFCAFSLKKKTSTQCSACDHLICGSHIAKKLCRDC